MNITNNKKILIVCSHFWPSIGGIESRLGQFSEKLISSGYGVTVLTSEFPSRTSNFYNGVEIQDVKLGQGNFREAIQEFVSSGIFQACILVQDPLGEIIWGLEGLAPTVTTKVFIQPVINEDGFSKWKNDQIFCDRLSKILSDSGTVITMTRNGPDQNFMENRKIPHFFIPNATTPQKKSGDFRAHFGIAKTDFVILHVANLWRVKNHLGLLNSLTKIPTHWKLILIGHTTGEPDYVQSVKEALEKRSDVLFVPGLSKEWVASAMQAADVIVLASTGEGSPNTILEAMSHQRPWIATPTCGAANDHLGGIICELSEFKNQLKALDLDPKLREQIGQIGYEHWSQCYSWPVVMDGWINLIENGNLEGGFLPSNELSKKMLKIKEHLGRRIALGKEPSTMNRPLISIILTTHNRPILLERALNSLLSQSFINFEIILCADQGNQETKLLAANKLRERDIFLCVPGLIGPAETRNLGIQLARGNWIAFLDDDDTLDQKFLSDASAFLTDHKKLYYFDFKKIYENRDSAIPSNIRIEKMHHNNISSDTIFVSNYIPNNSLFVSAFIAKKCTFDCRLQTHEDWDWLIALRMQEDLDFIHIPIDGPNVHLTEAESRNRPSTETFLDYLYIYRKWRGLNPQIKAARTQLLANAGLNLSLDFL